MATPPVLLLVFNRPDTTTEVFEAIRRARPQQLFVAADGPRAERPGEAERCAETRRIATAVDWPCEVRTLFRDRNLGCSRALAEAITWFFEEVPEGVILEDDAVPVPAFFEYCAGLLDTYRERPDVFMISGFTYRSREDGTLGHWLARYATVWGWASWADRWRLYERTLPEFDAEFARARATGRIRGWEQDFWHPKVDKARRGVIDTWDWQWHFTLLKHGGRCALPTVNLVHNIGYGHPDATHTAKADKTMEVPVAHDVDGRALLRQVRKPPFADERMVTYGILKQRITPFHYLQWCLPDRFSVYVREAIRRLGIKEPGRFLRFNI